MFIAPDSKELPNPEERKKIIDRAQQTLKNALLLLERLDKLEEWQAANHAHARAQTATLTY